MRRGMKVEEYSRDEFLKFDSTAEVTDIDYDEPLSKTFETHLSKNEMELLGKEFNDGIDFFTTKLDIEVIYKDTPHYELKKF